MYEILVIDKNGLSKTIHKTNSYDAALKRYVKEVTKLEEEPLEKGECIKVKMLANEFVWLEREIRG